MKDIDASGAVLLLEQVCFRLTLEREFKKGEVFPYSLPSVGPGANPGVQAVSPQVTSKK